MAHKYFSQDRNYQNVNFYLDIIDKRFLSKDEFANLMNIYDSEDIIQLYIGKLYLGSEHIKTLEALIDDSHFSKDHDLDSFFCKCHNYGIAKSDLLVGFNLSDNRFCLLKKIEPHTLLDIFKSKRDYFPFDF